MNDIDFQHANLLLDVIAKVANIGPMNQAIAGEAQQELKVILAECEENRKERAEQIRAEEHAAEQQRLSAVEEDKPSKPFRPLTDAEKQGNVERKL